MTLTNLPKMTLEQAIEYAKTSGGVKFLLTPDLIAEIQTYAKEHGMFKIPSSAPAMAITKEDGFLDFEYWSRLDLGWEDCELPQIELVVSKPEPIKHPQAELMLQYAQDALETDKPWERWECCWNSNNIWNPCSEHPVWQSEFSYRRKPKTININGFEVPEPLRKAPVDGTKVYLVDLAILLESKIIGYVYQQSVVANRFFLEAGVLHLTKEAAELHAKALLSFTQL